MTSHTGQQIITIQILPNISRSKENQAMKFVQFIKLCVKKCFFKGHAKNELARLVPNLFLFF